MPSVDVQVFGISTVPTGGCWQFVYAASTIADGSAMVCESSSFMQLTGGDI